MDYLLLKLQWNGAKVFFVFTKEFFLLVKEGFFKMINFSEFSFFFDFIFGNSFRSFKKMFLKSNQFYLDRNHKAQSYSNMC